MAKTGRGASNHKIAVIGAVIGLLILAACELVQNHSNFIISATAVFVLTLLFVLELKSVSIKDAYILPLQTLAMICLAVYDKTDCYILYLILVIIQWIIRPNITMAWFIPFIMVCSLFHGTFIILRFIRYNKINLSLLFRLKIDVFFYFVLVSLLLVIIKKQMMTSDRLNYAIRKIKEQSEQLQKNAALEERTRIAREIHDTVGHTLTTASLSIEAGIVMLKEQNESTVIQLKTAREQVRVGLDQIRQSVRLLADHSQPFHLHEALKVLFSEVHKNSGIIIHERFDLFTPELEDEWEKIIFKAVREGITNAIRHGKCKHIAYEESFKEKEIRVSLTDDGTGCAKVKMGMGLGAIQKDMDNIGGQLFFGTGENEGFSLVLKIPRREVSGG